MNNGIDGTDGFHASVNPVFGHDFGHNIDDYRLRMARIRAEATGEPVTAALSVFEGTGRHGPTDADAAGTAGPAEPGEPAAPRPLRAVGEAAPPAPAPAPASAPPRLADVIPLERRRP